MAKIRVIELFAGIGAVRKALAKGGADYEIVDAIEINNVAINAYNRIYNTNIQAKDILNYYPKKEQIGEIDLLWNSSPCQDISTAGKNMGAKENSGTRSSLVYEAIRVAKELMPKYIIWENVKNLLSKRHRNVLDDYIDKLDKLGYVSYYQVLNSKDYGVPQSRERVFVVSIRKDVKKIFNFPKPEPLNLKVIDILQKTNIDDYYYKICNSMMLAYTNKKVKDVTNDNYTHAVTTNQVRWNNAGLIRDAKGLRYFTALECWRLMGFDDSDYYKASTQCGRWQLYKLAGNSVVVNVIEKILKELL